VGDIDIKVISTTKNSNKFQKTRSWKEKSVEDVVTLGLTIHKPLVYNKSILMQKKIYGNSNIPPCKNIIFKKSSKRHENPSIYYNSINNLKFQHKPKHHL
jgi:hypothetical protein